MTGWRLALTGHGTRLHVMDPASLPGQPATLCGRPNACTAAGYGTVEAPRSPLCERCAASAGVAGAATTGGAAAPR